MTKAVFLDRDGIINELVYDSVHGTVDSPIIASQVSLMYGISELIKEVSKMGFLTIVCSNQPSVGLGKTTLANFKAVSSKIQSLLKKDGAKLDYEYYCMHHPFTKIRKYQLDCDCKKPSLGLLLKATKDHDIDLSKSWMIGDGVDDIKAGKTAGCSTILLANLKSSENLRIIEEQLGDIKPDFIIKKLPEALKIITK